jgi:hypothetical protein
MARGVNPTQLEVTLTSAIHRSRCSGALERFLASAVWMSTHWSWEKASARTIDALLARFVQSLFDSGSPFYVGKYAVLGAQKARPELKFKLTRAWNALKSWNAKLDASHRLPIPESVVWVMAACALEEGIRGGPEAVHWLSFAVLCQVGFACLLRTGELLGLRAKDIRITATASGEPCAILALPRPKNRAFMGRNQFVVLRCPYRIRWLRWLVEGLPPSCRLWPSDARKFAAYFSSTLGHLQLSDLRLTPGSLRPGGATQLFVDGMEVHRLLFVGRWKSVQSLQCYIQEAMAQSVWESVPCHVQSLLSAQVQAARALLVRAPLVPWTTFGSRSRQWKAWRQL